MNEVSQRCRVRTGPTAVVRDTVFAVATARGRAAIAVVRVSGPDAASSLMALTGRTLPPPPRMMATATLRDPQSGENLDEGMAVYFPGPRSATGEDVAEFHLHGGRTTVAGVVAALAALPGLRPAAPGEFTRRAFDNGKLDLTAAEAVADLVDAETDGQRRQALRQLSGSHADLYDGWRARLLNGLARLAATIDFADEEIPAGLEAEVRRDMASVAGDIGAHLADGRRGERLRDGYHVAIVGAPNVGKSSLLNRLAGRDAAIVAATAGTTRDVVETHLDLAGYPVVIADTAGLRDGGDAIEREGARRARSRAAAADLRLVVVNATDWPGVPAESIALCQPGDMVVVNKVDLKAVPDTAGWEGCSVHPVSALTGGGLDALVALVGERAAAACSAEAGPAITRARHRRALEDCAAALARFATRSETDLAAEELRLATACLGRITGRVDVEDLLDVVFREFCIGK